MTSALPPPAGGLARGPSLSGPTALFANARVLASSRLEEEALLRFAQLLHSPHHHDALSSRFPSLLPASAAARFSHTELRVYRSRSSARLLPRSRTMHLRECPYRIILALQRSPLFPREGRVEARRRAIRFV